MSAGRSITTPWRRYSLILAWGPPPEHAPRRYKPAGRKFYDDPRFIHPPEFEHEYGDVEPIPFFPADLPRLGRDPFLWTAAELASAVAHAHSTLFNSPKDMQCT